VKENHPFAILAWVILPDHLHCIWRLPEGDDDFSIRWQLIKTRFTRRAREERKVWQGRFWEHVIKDEGDLIRHVEYIHYNPVKHGYARSPMEWPHSSFKRFVENGMYSSEWGNGGPGCVIGCVGME
ncbi:transposase, partial [bacterium]